MGPESPHPHRMWGWFESNKRSNSSKHYPKLRLEDQRGVEPRPDGLRDRCSTINAIGP